MFLDRELEDIRKAKDILAVRCEFRRSLFRLELLGLKSKTRGAFSALKAGMVAAELVRELLIGRKDGRR
jgi:hypothetical protein